jgi:hypothetical protein
MRKSLLVILFFLTSQFGFTQISSNSPFSYYGLGESGGADHGYFSGIGNSTITQFDSTVINFYNPASYNTLAKEQPLFSFGISSRLSNYSEGTNKYFNSLTKIQHFAMAFPIASNFGLAFGLKPYSSKGYSISTGETVGSDSIVYRYSGSGGINEVFLGLSTDLIKLKNTRLAVGANLGYLFGQSTNTRKSGLYASSPAFYSGGINTKLIDISSFHFDLGAYFSQTINNQIVTLTAVFEPSQSLNGKFENGLFYSTNIDDPRIYDTITFSSIRAEMKNGATSQFGINYKLNMPANENGRRLNSQLSFNAMYSMTNWDLFSDPFDTDSTVYPNTSKLSFGVQYSPETKIIEQATLTKFYERMQYRAGYYNYSLPYQIGNEQVKDQGVTIGFGLPITIQKSLSSINFGFSYGTRGVSAVNSFKENYYGINLGITIAPGSSDRWFRKSKLN